MSNWESIITQNSLPLDQAALREAVNQGRFLDLDSMKTVVDDATNIIAGITKIVTSGFKDLAEFVTKLSRLFKAEKLNGDGFDRFRINLATIIADTNRFERILGDQNLINARNIKLPWKGDTEFTAAAESLMGRGRMFSNNSDAYYCTGFDKPIDENKAPVLLALVADGVSGNGIERDYATGKIAANTVRDYLRDHETELDLKYDHSSSFNHTRLKEKFSEYEDPALFKSELTVDSLFRYLLKTNPSKELLINNYEQLIKPGLKSSTKMRDLYLHSLGYQTFTSPKTKELHLQCVNRQFNTPVEAELTKFRKTGETSSSRLNKNDLGSVDLTKIEKEAEEFFANKSLEDILRLALVNDAHKAFNTLKVLTDSTDAIAEACKAAEISIGKGLNAAAAVAIALDAGEKVILLSTGDTIACAFNGHGIIPSSVNTAHVDKVSGRLTVEVPSALWSKVSAINKKFHISIVDKASIQGLLLASDGAVDNDMSQEAYGKNNWESSNLKKRNQEIFGINSKDKFNPQRIIRSALLAEANGTDDKTTVVLSKGNYLAA